MNIEYLAKVSQLEIDKNEYKEYEEKLFGMLSLVEDIKDFETNREIYGFGKSVNSAREDKVSATEFAQDLYFTVPKVVE